VKAFGLRDPRTVTLTTPHSDRPTSPPQPASAAEAAAAAQLASADAEQRAMMEERVILTDYYDNPIGDGSKTESERRPARPAPRRAPPRAARRAPGSGRRGGGAVSAAGTRRERLAGRGGRARRRSGPRG